jgi:hypothetical protein
LPETANSDIKIKGLIPDPNLFGTRAAAAFRKRYNIVIGEERENEIASPSMQMR